MAHLPRWGSAFVLSPENLSAFLDWFALQPQDVQLAHCKLFVVEHRDSSMIQHFRKVPPALMWGRDQSQNPVVTEMETRPCDVENCWRCTSEVGGYVFRWIGPWSCMEAVRLAEEVGFGPSNWKRSGASAQPATTAPPERERPGQQADMGQERRRHMYELTK